MITRPAVATALLALVAAVPSTALAQRPPERTAVLSSSTVVQTTGSGTTEVFIPAPARLSARIDNNPSVRLTGAGRLVGMWLEPVDGGSSFLSSYRLPAFAGGRQVTYGTSRSVPCKGVPNDTLPVSSDCTGVKAPTHFELGRGLYRLTVLTDGRPVRVSLDLQGLRPGRSAVTLTTALRSAQKALPVRESVQDRLVSFGAATDVGRPVQTFTLATATFTKGSTLKEASACERADAGEFPLAFGPHCPGGQASGFGYTAGAAGEESSGASGFASSSSGGVGPVGLGGSFGDSTRITLGQALGVWLERPAT